MTERRTANRTANGIDNQLCQTEPSTSGVRKVKDDRIELVLLPPREDNEVTEDDIKNFYIDLTKILLSND